MGTDYVAGREFMAGFVAAFTERGGKVIQQQWIPMGTKDVAPYITALKEADVVVPWLAGVTATAGLRQLREYKVKMPVVMCQTGFMAHAKQIVEIGDDGVGIITTDAYVWTIDTPENKKLTDAYYKRWGEPLAGAGYGGYATVLIALAALEKTGGDTSPEALAKALDETELAGILGTFRFGDARVGFGNQMIHRCIKVDGEYTTEVLAYVTVKTDKVGDKLVQSLVKKSW